MGNRQVPRGCLSGEEEEGEGGNWKGQEVDVSVLFWKRFVLAWARAGEVTGVTNETKNIRCVGVAEEGAEGTGQATI